MGYFVYNSGKRKIKVAINNAIVENYTFQKYIIESRKFAVYYCSSETPGERALVRGRSHFQRIINDELHPRPIVPYAQYVKERQERIEMRETNRYFHGGMNKRPDKKKRGHLQNYVPVDTPETLHTRYIR